MLRHDREVVHGPQQTAISGSTERELRHSRTPVGDVRGGNADVCKHIAHCFRKHHLQALRFGDRKDDRQSRPLADEQLVLTAAKPRDVAVPVAESRGDR